MEGRLVIPPASIRPWSDVDHRRLLSLELSAWLKLVRAPHRGVVHTPPWPGLAQDGARQKVTVDRGECCMALHLPLHLDRRLPPNQPGPALLARAQEVHGIAIETILETLTPEHIPVGAHRTPMASILVIGGVRSAASAPARATKSSPR